jgi:soluble lytic murein transglycosylase-like protein
MKDLIKKYADKYEIPFKLLLNMVHAESGGNPFAVRYEDHYRWLIKPLDKYHWHAETEKIGQKTSWGLLQVMGAVARERGFKGRYLAQLCDPEEGLKYGCKHLKWNYNRYNNWYDAVSAYNQGSNRKNSEGNYQNQSYVDKVMQGVNVEANQ